MAGHGSDLTITAISFRPRTDLVEEADDSGWISPLNTNWVAQDIDINFRIRIGIKIQGITGDANVDFRLYYAHNVDSSFSSVTNTSSVVRCVTSGVAGYDDDDPTTQLITAPGDFAADNELVNAGDDLTGSMRLVAAEGSTQWCETEWVLNLSGNDLVRGDTVEFRLRNSNGSNLNGGYWYSPIVSIQNSRLDIKGSELRVQGSELKIQ